MKKVDWLVVLVIYALVVFILPKYVLRYDAERFNVYLLGVWVMSVANQLNTMLFRK